MRKIIAAAFVSVDKVNADVNNDQNLLRGLAALVVLEPYIKRVDPRILPPELWPNAEFMGALTRLYQADKGFVQASSYEPPVFTIWPGSYTTLLDTIRQGDGISRTTHSPKLWITFHSLRNGSWTSNEDSTSVARRSWRRSRHSVPASSGLPLAWMLGNGSRNHGALTGRCTK